MNIRLLSAVVFLAVVVTPPFARAQKPDEPLRLGPITFNGDLRTRVEGWDWFAGEANNGYAFSGSLLRFSLGRQTKTLDWQVEFAAPVLLGLPDDAIAPGIQGQLGLGATYFGANDRSRNAGMAFVKQASVRFKAIGGRQAHSLRLGRMEFVDGAEVMPANGTLTALKRSRIVHRLLGNFAFSHVGRSFDGLQYVYNTSGHNLTFLGARPTRGVFQADGWGGLDIAVLYGAYTRQIQSSASAGELRLFGMYYDDWRAVLKTDNRPAASRRGDDKAIRMGTFGGHYLQAFEKPSGTADLLLWGALQTGSWGVQDHRAGAFSAEAGYQPPIWGKLRPWIRGGFHYGSGDGDPADRTHSTFFQVLPTPRWYARFPFYNLMNNLDSFGQLILRPSARFSVRGEVHSLRLANRNDLWYLGGGAFQPWTFGFVGRPSGGNTGLATVAEIAADYQINSKASFNVFFANAWSRKVLQSIHPKDGSALFGYVELNYRF